MLDTRLLTFTIAKCRKFPEILKCSGVPEIFLHFWSAGIFLHFWSAGNFPALPECRKFSCTSGVPEIFLHFRSAGNFPALLECRKFSCTSECRKFSGISGLPEIFQHFRIFHRIFLVSFSTSLYYQLLLQYTCSYTFQFFYLHEHFCRAHVPRSYTCRKHVSYTLKVNSEIKQM